MSSTEPTAPVATKPVPAPPPKKRAREAAAPSSERPASQSETTWNKDPVIELVNVTKSFGSLRVLDGVTCRIPRGGSRR